MLRSTVVLWRASALAVILMLVLTPQDAWAYLDIGTGSYFLQLAAAGFLASYVTLRVYFQRLKDWVRGKKPPAEDLGEPKP